MMIRRFIFPGLLSLTFTISLACSLVTELPIRLSSGGNRLTQNLQENITAENYPKVDGSTSTRPLGTLVACKLFQLHCEWYDWIDGTKTLLPDVTDYQGEFPTIQHNGTHDAYVNLITHAADLILVARLPSPDELKLASEHGVSLNAEAIARDAFVFILNENNPIEDLTIEQIQGIYTGEITNWKELGGNNVDIHPYQRNDNSGSQELMKSMVMKDKNMIEPLDMLLLWGMMGPINALSEDLDGIGYSVYYFEEFMAPNEEIKLCAVEGVLPGYESIQADEYPFTTEVYAIIRNDLAEDSLAKQLRDWLSTPAGQEVIKESGYVPIE